MAVNVTDNRTIVDEADATTNFNQGTANTTDYAEGTGSISLAVNVGTDQIFWTGTGIDLSAEADGVIYLWSSNTATQNGWKESTIADSSHGLWLSDGTNEIVILQAGNDRDVFKHSDTQVQFQCFVFDLQQLAAKTSAGEVIEVSGSSASFDESSVTEIGAYYVTTSKALGGGYNCFLDVIRYGTDGITVYGGSTSDRGNFLEIVERDRSKSDAGTGANQFYAGGIIREYTAGAYGLQGKLTFGTSSATGDAWFDDDGVTITLEDRDVGGGTWFSVVGNSTDTNYFSLTNSSISTAGPNLGVDCSSSNVGTMIFDTVTFNGLYLTLSFPTDSATNTHTVNNCTFNNCQIVIPNTADFTNNLLVNSQQAAGALQITNAGTDSWSGNTVISDGTGHAIYIPSSITTPAEFTLTDHTFIGFADQAGTAANRVILNFSGGEVTIINDGSGDISYENFLASTTIIVNPPPTTTVNVATVAGVPVENARVFLQASDGTGPLPFEDTVTITSASTTASVSHTAHGLSNGNKVVIRGAVQEEYNGVYAISNVATNSYDYTFAGSGTSPATGTIKATGVLIHALTPSSGIVTDSRALATDQPVTGHARKSSATPFYKSSAVVGTVDSLDDTTFTAVMILDE